MMSYTRERALELLRAGTAQPNTEFREGQEEAIRHTVEGRGRLLVVQKTGWGKSFVYFIATKLLRESGHGPALLVSPLLSLMRNQIAAAERMGVRALTINSENRDVWDEVEARIDRDEVDILLVSPERLANQRFTGKVLSIVAGRISLLVIDEAHCISDWGHDFRPHYRLIERIVKELPRNLRLLGTTATANNRVMEDLQHTLGPSLDVSRGNLDRPSLTLQTISLPNQAERLAWLAEHVPAFNGSGVIYTLTIRDAMRVSEWLKSRGLNVETYSSESGEDRRPELEQALLDNRVKALVATTALGMGFDKPDLGFVVHFQSPGSAVAYYQQVGRAGRALPSAYGVLLSGREDEDITDYFIERAFPTREEVQEVVQALEHSRGGFSARELEMHVNMSHTRIQNAIQLLSLESPAPIVKQGSKWQLTISALGDEFWQRADRLTRIRREEQRQMREYVALTGGHMEYLIRALDGEPSGVTPPSLPPLPTTARMDLVLEAVAFLKRTNLDIEPRKQWPSGGMPRYSVARAGMPREYRAMPGKALCAWGDAGWSELVRLGKYVDGRFPDELVQACAGMFREWSPDPSPEWVTCVPSLRHTNLVPDFAGRLAQMLGLPFLPVLCRTEGRPEQKSMANSAQQARNLDGALAICGDVSSGPALLVDDMVDSGWTMTVSAWLLRKGGSGEVFPLALARV